MDLLHEALRAGRGPTLGRAGCPRRVLVAGGAGALGAEVLEQLLACGEFMQVSVLVTQPINAALRGLTTLPLTELDGAAWHDTGLLVFDHVRHANGREAAFLHPDPAALPALAARLLARGVQRLVVVSPHASATLPEALKHGLATRDEQAVASMGFEQLVIVRPTLSPHAVRAAGTWQRVADWVLAQLQLMVPQREKPVRARKVAHFVVQLAVRLADAPAGTRVAPPELVWQAAQVPDVAGLAQAWLQGQEWVPLHSARMRM